jgi:hypothetical protein
MGLCARLRVHDLTRAGRLPVRCGTPVWSHRVFACRSLLRSPPGFVPSRSLASAHRRAICRMAWHVARRAADLTVRRMACSLVSGGCGVARSCCRRNPLMRLGRGGLQAASRAPREHSQHESDQKGSPHQEVCGESRATSVYACSSLIPSTREGAPSSDNGRAKSRPALDACRRECSAGS